MDNPIDRQIARVRARGVGASDEINPFWKAQLARLETLLSTQPEASYGLIQKALGYNARRLPAGVERNRDAPHWPAVQHAIRSGSVRDLEGQAAQDAAQTHFLARKGLLDAYLAWLDRQRLQLDLGLGRLFWYAERLEARLKALDRARPQVILEIGSGSGRFARMMLDRGLVRHYVMVDLPEMLLNSMITSSTLVQRGVIDMRLDETPDFTLERPTFWFLTTSEIARTPDASVDVAVNFNSLMEMDEEVRDFYLAQVARVLRAGGLFYNVNRMQRAMTRRSGEAFESNPLTYPYDPSDRILEWEPDECQESCRARELVSRHESFAISRMHLKA